MQLLQEQGVAHAGHGTTSYVGMGSTLWWTFIPHNLRITASRHNGIAPWTLMLMPVSMVASATAHGFYPGPKYVPVPTRALTPAAVCLAVCSRVLACVGVHSAFMTNEAPTWHHHATSAPRFTSSMAILLLRTLGREQTTNTQ